MPPTNRGTESLGVTRKYDVSDVISLLDVARYPLLAILTNAGKDPVTKQGNALKKKETTDPEFKWFEDKFGAREDIVSGNQAGATSLVVTNGSYFSIGDVLLCVKSTQATNNPTGEVMLVTNVNTNTLTLQRQVGDGSLGGGLLQQNDIIWIIGNANEEGASIREIKATAIAEAINYCQIFRTTIGITETARNTVGWTKESDFDYQTRKKGIEHLVDVERAFMFGKKELIMSGVHPKRFTGGIFQRVNQVVSNVTTRDDFNGFLRTLFTHGNSEKYLLASGYVLDKISSFAHDKLQIVQGEKTFGLSIVKYQSPHGTLNILKHDLLAGDLYGKAAIGLDMEALTYRFLSNRDTKLLTNRQAPGEDSNVNEYLTECGLQLEQPERHAVVKFA
ncbi:MAG: DUF5309 family protein [Parcubacteria group bacterium]|jgi:hypothetical protein